MQCCATARSSHDAQKFSAKFIHFWLAYNLYGHLVSVRGSIVQRGVAIAVGRKGTVAIQVTKKMSDTTVGYQIHTMIPYMNKIIVKIHDWSHIQYMHKQQI